jgi:broad specificity phosphatase PhoE
MVTTLYLVRHGETEGSGAKRYHGSIDIPLSENGILQVRRVSLFVREHLKSSAVLKEKSYLKEVHRQSDSRRGLHSETLAAVYCSDLSRSAKSAEIVAGPYGLKPVVVPELRERSFGIWEGMTFSEIKERYPEDFGAWAGDPLKYSPPRGESTLEVKERIIPALDRIIGSHTGENLAIVAHGGVNRIVLCHILGIPLKHIFRVEQDYGCLNIVEFWENYPVVKLVNGLMHGECTVSPADEGTAHVSRKRNL